MKRQLGFDFLLCRYYLLRLICQILLLQNDDLLIKGALKNLQNIITLQQNGKAPVSDSLLFHKKNVVLVKRGLSEIYQR